MPMRKGPIAAPMWCGVARIWEPSNLARRDVKQLSQATTSIQQDSMALRLVREMDWSVSHLSTDGAFRDVTDPRIFR